MIELKDETLAKFYSHVKEAQEINNKVLWVSLQGSQNYGLDTINSDVDTRAIVCPTINEVILNKKPVSYTHVRENNEHIDFKDIRLFFNNLRKQNINTLETLFTPYTWVSVEFEKYFYQIREMRESFANYDPKRMINGLAGQAKQKFKAVTHVTPSTKDNIEKYGYDGKNLCHLMRMRDMMKRVFYQGMSFEKALYFKPIERAELMWAKNHDFTLSRAIEIAKKASLEVAVMLHSWEETDTTGRKETDDFLDNILCEMISGRNK